MFYELIATVFAGFGAGGLALLARRMSAGRLPGWSVPVAAGLAMILYAIWSEYSWAGRTVANLPQGLAVVRTVETSSPFRPWTYLAPMTSRVMTADVGNALRHPDAPELRLTTLYLFARWLPVNAVPQLVDCGRPARADIANADTLTLPVPEEDWITLTPEDPLITTLCPSS